MHSATCSHPWRREVSLKCVVSIDTSILPRAAVCWWAQPQCPCLSAGACWLPNLVVTASIVVECMTTDMSRAAVEGFTNISVVQTSTPPPLSKGLCGPRNGRSAVPKHRFRALWCAFIASWCSRTSSTSLCTIWHRGFVIWTSNATIISVCPSCPMAGTWILA